MRAYVLVNAKMGKDRDVGKKIATLAGVKMANACWGVPDIFVVAEVANADELNKLVIDKIQSLEGHRIVCCLRSSLGRPKHKNFR